MVSYITLTEDIRIEADPVVGSFNLQRRQVTKSGKNKGDIRWETLAYSGSVATCLRRAAILDVLEGVDDISLPDYAKRLEACSAAFSKLAGASEP